MFRNGVGFRVPSGRTMKMLPLCSDIIMRPDPSGGERKSEIRDNYLRACWMGARVYRVSKIKNDTGVVKTYPSIDPIAAPPI